MSSLRFFILVLLALAVFAFVRSAWDGSSRVSSPLRPVLLYYYQSEKDRDESGNILCSRAGLAPVFRAVPDSATVIEETVRLLIRGELSANERASGFTSEYPIAGFSLTDASLSDGVLTLSFSDSESGTNGGACRVGILWFQIEMTARQFPEVREVRFLPEELFQP